jgi:thioesterase domain-containing protein
MDMRTPLLVRIQAGSPSRPPLLMFQPIGGTVYPYIELAKHLGAEWPVYAFRALGIEPGEPIYSDLAAMAERNVEELIQRFPDGPYYIGGYSSGGTLAYEVASQLMEMGREVPLVWLADSGSTEQYRRLDIDRPEDWIEAVNGFKDLAPQAWRSLRAAFDHDPTLRDVIVNTYRALATYTPRRLRTRVLYIRAEERDSLLDHHPQTWWMDLVDGPFAMANSPGNHLTMMDIPHVTTMARILVQHLTAMESAVSAPQPGQRLPEQVVEQGGATSLSVVAPSGIRVEGLDIESTIRLFQLFGGVSPQ